MARRILSVCYEECLPPSTLEFLRSSGCEMKCAREIGAAIQFFETLPFDLVLINQTVSASQEHLFASIVREQSDIPILVVSNTPELIADATICLKPPVSPECLFFVIRDLVPVEHAVDDEF